MGNYLSPYPKTLNGQGVFVFVVAPFCSCPRRWFLEFCLSFFFVALPLSAATFRRGQSNKNTTQGVFFWLRPRGKAGEGEAPCRRPTGLLLPLPFAGAAAKKTLW